MDGVHPDLVDRPEHRDHRRQRPDPHRRRDRLPRAPDLPADRRRGARRRHHHAHRRRHRPGRGHQGHHGHARRLAPGPDARGDGRLPGQRAAARQGQHASPRRRMWEQLRGRRRRLQAARGLGHRRRPRSTPACAWPTPPGVQVAHPHRHAQRGRLRRGHPARDRRPGHPRVPHRGRGRRARARHHHGRRAPQRAARPRPTRPGRTPATPSPSTSTC